MGTRWGDWAVHRAGAVVALATGVAVASLGACSGSSSVQIVPAVTTVASTSSPATSPPSTSAASTTPPSTLPTAAPLATGASTTSTTARPRSTTTERGPTTKYLSASASGTQVDGIVGDVWKVGLLACDGCGARWIVTGVPAPDTISSDGEADAPPPAPTTVPGASTSTTSVPVVAQVFTFRAIAAHTTGLVIGYYPPDSTTPTHTFTLTFHVRP